MAEANILIVSDELNIKPQQVRAVAELLGEDATVPFIARYRKEVTGGLDEVAIISIRDRLQQLGELDKRREAVLKSLKEQEKLTPELEKSVMEAPTLSKLEDIYLPYRPKRRTRATVAKEKGLEPLAERLFSQGDVDIDALAAEFLDDEKGVASQEDALQGARDIIAEWINEHGEAREGMRNLFSGKAQMSSKVVKGKEDEAAKYRDYFEWKESALKAPSHRILAVLRGVEEGYLSAHFMPEEEEGIVLLEGQFVKGKGAAAEQVSMAAGDSYRRLMGPSMETEFRAICKKRADEEAIRVFAQNVRELLIASPLGEKAVLAVDPGLRTGCKIVCLSRQGTLIANDTIYPLEPHNKKDESAKKIKELCEKHRIEAIAVGNGTGGRDALGFCKGLGIPDVIVTMVNESGASVYSASETARREFPDYDVTVRGAASIGRRLQDPLAELVKIDPKAIGVGQYQHDVDQKELKQSLDDVVMSCVNAVGVEVNTASRELLRYVSGLSAKMADSIVVYRDSKGAFRARDDLKLVSGMGPKTYEQAVGFLRIPGAPNPLDASAVHPESYHIVEKMAADMNCGIEDLIRSSELREAISLEKYVTGDVGMPTLRDIMDELAKPGRDPRKEFELFTYKEGVNEMSDLEKGMVLPGVITNVTNFGAFVDVGVHQDGLVHISELSDEYVSDPHNAVKVNQKVTVTVTDIDMARKRISLSMRTNPFEAVKPKEVKKNPPERKQPQQKRNTGSGKPAPKKNVQQKKDTVTGSGPFAELGRKWKDGNKK